MSVADYLAWEAEQTVRHDYLDGEVFAMAGVALDITAEQLFAEVPEECSI
jgi:hypothetical protein